MEQTGADVAAALSRHNELQSAVLLQRVRSALQQHSDESLATASPAAAADVRASLAGAQAVIVSLLRAMLPTMVGPITQVCSELMEQAAQHGHNLQPTISGLMHRTEIAAENVSILDTQLEPARDRSNSSTSVGAAMAVGALDNRPRRGSCTGECPALAAYAAQRLAASVESEHPPAQREQLARAAALLLTTPQTECASSPAETEGGQPSLHVTVRSEDGGRDEQRTPRHGGQPSSSSSSSSKTKRRKSCSKTIAERVSERATMSLEGAYFSRSPSSRLRPAALAQLATQPSRHDARVAPAPPGCRPPALHSQESHGSTSSLDSAGAFATMPGPPLPPISPGGASSSSGAPGAPGASPEHGPQCGVEVGDGSGACACSAAGATPSKRGGLSKSPSKFARQPSGASSAAGSRGRLVEADAPQLRPWQDRWQDPVARSPSRNGKTSWAVAQRGLSVLLLSQSLEKRKASEATDPATALARGNQRAAARRRAASGPAGGEAGAEDGAGLEDDEGWEDDEGGDLVSDLASDADPARGGAGGGGGEGRGTWLTRMAGALAFNLERIEQAVFEPSSRLAHHSQLMGQPGNEQLLRLNGEALGMSNKSLNGGGGGGGGSEGGSSRALASPLSSPLRSSRKVLRDAAPSSTAAGAPSSAAADAAASSSAAPAPAAAAPAAPAPAALSTSDATAAAAAAASSTAADGAGTPMEPQALRASRSGVLHPGDRRVDGAIEMANPPPTGRVSRRWAGMGIKRRIQGQHRGPEGVWDLEGAGMLHQSSFLALARERRYFVIHPLSTARLLWDAIVGVAALLSGVLAPLHFAFRQIDVDEADQLPVGGGTGAGGVVVNVLFLLVPLANLCTATQIKGQLLRTPREIGRHYLRSATFGVDILSAAAGPLQWTASCAGCAAAAPSVGAWLSIVRVHTVFPFLAKLEASTTVSPNLARTIRMTFLSLLAWHWIACIWTALAAADGQSWFKRLQQSGDRDVGDGAPSDVYIWSAYWTMTMLSTVGFGDIYVVSLPEAGIMMVIIFFSILLYSGLIANTSTFFLSSDSTWNQHRQRVETAKAYMHLHRFPQSLQYRVLNYLEYLWGTTKGLDEADIVSRLPDTLQRSISLFTNDQIIKATPLFKDATAEVSAFVVRMLQLRVYVPGDVLFRRGDESHELYIMQRGLVEVLGVTATGGSVFLGPSMYFGELGAVLGRKRSHTVRAYTHCHVHSLSRDALNHLLIMHPECIDNLMEAMAAYGEWQQLQLELREKVGQPPAGASDADDRPDFSKRGSVSIQLARADVEAGREPSFGPQ